MEQNYNEQKTSDAKNEKSKKVMSIILSVIFILIGTLLYYPTVSQRKWDSLDNLMILFNHAIVGYLLALIICVVMNKIMFENQSDVDECNALIEKIKEAGSTW